MTRTRIVQGTTRKITEGKHNMYAAESIVECSASTNTETGAATGTTFSSPAPYGDCDKGMVTVANKLIGKAKREPGFNFDGTQAEDMQYGDKPPASASITKDPVFKLNDPTLAAYMNQLMTSLSMGKMETVALEMAKRFQEGTGKKYTSETLNKEIRGNSALTAYHTAFYQKLRTALQEVAYDPSEIKPLAMGLLNFSSFWDKASGLGITIHQVWSVKAELADYVYNRCTNIWKAVLKYTFYDHFGLDWDDIKKHGDDMIPQYHTGDFFKAWYILQHYRTARPFITEMTYSAPIAGYATV